MSEERYREVTPPALDDARRGQAAYRAEMNLIAAKRQEKAALRSRAAAETIARTWGLTIDGDRVIVD